MFLAASLEKMSADPGWGDVLIFDHWCYGGDGRGLASACACEDRRGAGFV
jgi:hypothetical protein